MQHQQGEHLSREWALLKDPVLHTERLEAIRSKKGYIIDMDGVIYHVSIQTFVKGIYGNAVLNSRKGCQSFAWC